MENKAIKNMEYWKKKNNIPGVEALADSGLTDGRAGSSAFQMATPGSSPNKIVGLAGAAAGMLGFGANALGKKDEGPKELLEGTGKTVEKVTGFKVSGGDEGTDVAGGTGTTDGAVAQPMAEDPNTALAMKSPLEQEDRPDPTYEGTDYYGSKEGVLGGQEIAKQNENFELDEENGRLMTTEQFGGEEGILINDPDDILEGAPYGNDDFDYRYKVEEDGSYTLISKGETGGVESPEENVPKGPMGPGGMGGVGEIKVM